MRVFLTGGNGFIGTRIATQLRERGDEVIAFVRSEARSTVLQGLGCTLATGDVTDSFSVEKALRDVDAVMHIAGRYELGLPKVQCAPMQDVNIGGTRHVLNAAIQAEIPKIVYASTVNVFGDTHGEKVNETYQRNPLKGFQSCYDESKYRAHLLAIDRIQKGAPIVIVQPTAVYGPGDYSVPGIQIMQSARGTLPALMLVDYGITLAHVDDVATGFVAALDRGEIGESYLLGGESHQTVDVMRMAADMAGTKFPTRKVSTSLLRFIAPIGPMILPRMGFPPNLSEMIKAGDHVTYFADDTKAREKLGYVSRPLEDGLRQTLEAEGVKVVS